MRIEDLVVLKKFSIDNDQSLVVEFKGNTIEGLTVNIKRGVWSYKPEFSEPSDFTYENIPIGTLVHSNTFCDYVIGVYDRTNTEHLNSMVVSARNAKRNPSCYDFDH